MLSDAQYKDLVEGKAVKVEGMTAKSGKSFNATLQVNAEKKGIEFIFENKGSVLKMYVVKQKCTTANIVIYSDISFFYYQKFFC